uniref:Uncharacterized protein LOC114331686 n=1 Tax=Diabrotica virgifera virgifera TaxID=50390 RepID=A0A6P7FWY6_DIAVI
MSLEDRCVRKVYKPIPKTQHRPVGISVYSAIKAPKIPFKRRFNFKKANWEKYTDELETQVKNIVPIPKNYDAFIKLVKRTSCKHIPRGCQQHYISGLNDEAKDIMTKYTEEYSKEPFSEVTAEIGERLR